MSKKPAAPETLATPGASLWAQVVQSYDLRSDELATLEDVCSITDMIASLTSAWADLGKPLTTTGSMGQEVIHPLIGEIRTQRMARNTLWRQLKLPDDGAAADTSTSARKAASARWSHGA